MGDFSHLKPTEAWFPIGAKEWDVSAARHLLMRTGFSASTDRVDAAVKAGLQKTLKKGLSGAKAMDPPEELAEFIKEAKEKRAKIRDASEREKREIRQELNRLNREMVLDWAMDWYTHSNKDENSALEKWALFLEDVFVVTVQKVKNPYFLYQYHLDIRKNCFSSFGDLCKSVSKQPAMIVFLDLQQNKKGKPNENFARELFELFMLGEGNYTEADIQEAARAFTGYRQVNAQFVLQKGQHDRGKKSVFGEEGNWTGDDVIDLALQQEGVLTHLPREMCRYFLSDTEVPDEYLRPLGIAWKDNGFDLGWLYSTFFQSRLFYSEMFRGNKIKSPNEFLFGLYQDLELDIPPISRRMLGAMRNMGQSFMNPPNVRGWVGGRNWINSATLQQRMQLVNQCFVPINIKQLNADEKLALEKVQENGNPRFTMDSDAYRLWLQKTPEGTLDHLLNRLLVVDIPDRQKQQWLPESDVKGRALVRWTRETLMEVMQSPYYSLS